MLSDYPFIEVMNDVKNHSQDELERAKSLKLIYQCIDHTSLNTADNEQSITNFCHGTLAMCRDQRCIGSVASVCVYPLHVELAHNILKDSGIKVASVAGSFPSGQLPKELKLREVSYAVTKGADEVDYVINRGFFLQGREDKVYDEIKEAKTICGDRLLKVIIECCDLGSSENIYRASTIALEAGADFVKTSPGKGSGGATAENVWAMLSAVRDFGKINKNSKGFKAAGGIASIDDAILYYRMARQIVFNNGISNQNFRIGTSRLTTTIFKLLTL